MVKIKYEYLFLVTIFIISTCGLIYELIAGTLASYLLGDSITQFSLIIGIYLFSMGIGSYLSKFFTNDHLINRFIEIEILIGLIGGLSAPLLFLIFNKVDFFEFYLYFIVFIIGCLVGLEIPLLMNILKDKFQFSALVSNVFTFDYIGALLASILFPVFFIPYLGLIETSIVFGIVNIGTALLMCFSLQKEIRGVSFLKIKAFFGLAILLITLFFSSTILSFSEKNLYGENIVFSKTTKHQRIVLTHERKNFNLYLNNNLQFSTFDEYRYHEMLVHPAMSFAKSIHHILILGGGDGLAAREILKYKEVQSITLVDLDEEMTSLFQKNKLFTKMNTFSLQDEKVEIINNDAFVWVNEKNNKKYDVVIIDFPDPSNFSLGKLYTNSFYASLQKKLTDDAVLVVQSTSPFFAPKSFWCVNKTIQSEFISTIPYHVYLPSFGEWGFTLATNYDFDNQIKRSVENLKFYNYNLNDFTYFSKDMRVDEVEINKLNNQKLVSYFNAEWSGY
ncbi:Polyamine aminopropyltransferase 1 [Flavobacterium sp. 9AF]|uniref:polyamine aminopropyltransferase n=1 Tax=Flavobacterium sp. 9AF TaxID=2653142 RepID=UPI0012F33B85|nr:polyamine aminopropyltransferase [Flavobacterium sp. 9AF]VXC02411.1 Polyamine aminopropyltransferase 1 [Flavobacterium sp. 9AF]